MIFGDEFRNDLKIQKYMSALLPEFMSELTIFINILVWLVGGGVVPSLN